ncbi:XRE family transcriptional regulator [Acinetobacter gyllenbergii]|uniref:helix-turn-helix domain-containing protein n=1 Tax=Acinetobacter gyllenbergii TaxID=134534 RepID=UPI0021CE025B|nr:XRE family transcriptional regulator [Acinetobacter gyllenbergii]MCU4579611.1 XRE family transcriptional regulator [Acinetobacter gyllenbergii]
MSHSEVVLEYVGQNIRLFRTERQLSQQELADQAGVSRRTIAALETGQVNISLAKLDAIATALAVDFKRLVSASDLNESAIVNSLAWQGQFPESRATLLAAVPTHAQVELWNWTLAVGEVYQAEADQKGWQELIYVLEGELTLSFEQEDRVLQAGESILFESSVNYRYLNQGNRSVRFIRNVIY